ncbi:hypothetical protein ABB37_00649 [Leptomonas pyrrhocoris]|uniref:Uncharacterized protein n=1 Tax=Leptomonas pyrrhocoris TaxID=157538 RepID=A0A0N0VHS4_LEPPY|nr:hypothetical protein ABB37_00649 [Leptomonas pyrrhocoris]KPA86501.1 hypothetical protein ABB37_00649 [Leptomonas pyrrhocoris]|eukprot:XP_015664940.1 hypothetical protein ABB37_00649 [Leptomonas pyrrhocoris]
MSSVAVPAAAVPASRLRSRSVNTNHAVSSKAAGAKASVTKRTASLRSAAVRPRSTNAPAAAVVPLAASSMAHRTRSVVKPFVPVGRQASAGDAGSAAGVAAPLLSPPANTSHPRGDAPTTQSAAAIAASSFRKTSSRNSKISPTTVQHSSGCASRLDSVCSSLLGSGDRGSVQRNPQTQQQHPPVPHLGHVFRTAPLTRAATTECILRSARQQQSSATSEERKKSSPPRLGRCGRTQSANDMIPPPSPRPAAAVAAVLSGRTFGSAPASRVNSVNSHLAEAEPTAVSRAPRTRVASAASGKRSASSNSDMHGVAPAASGTFVAAPSRSTGVRPLLAASRRLAQKETASTAGASRLRNLSASATQRSSSPSAQAKTDSRGARVAVAAGPSPSRKGARGRSDAAHVATADAAFPPPPPLSSKFQQTHTGCPPPLSFGGSTRGAATAGAAPKGPVSPIRRTATACPGSAQVYAAAPLPEEDATRDSAGFSAVVADTVFSCPWLKPGTFSTPTNRDGGREASEAPTVPYEGSTGLRPSMSLSPRTDFDSMSLSGRASYGM